jgi:hypothetical protein
MPHKSFLYFTSRRVIAYSWTKGELQRESIFSFNDEGVAEFAKYVAGAGKSLFYLLADFVEEDFAQENIPHLRGKDRRAVLARKLSQRYRDTTLAIALSLGIEAHGGRREERILYTAFTNTQQLQPWIAALRSREARVAGVFTVALVSAEVGKRVGFKAPRYLIVSLQQAGLRQTYIENGRMRFSRLGRVDFSNPRSIAENCALESGRIQQYLVNTHVLPREAPALDVLVLAPSEYKALYDDACKGTSQLRFHVLDLDQVGRDAGLIAAPEETLAEGLFLHFLAKFPAGEQFADDGLRRFYHLWRARVGMVAAGAAVFAFCLVFSGLKLLEIYQIDRQVEIDRQQQARASQEYARLQTGFPETPTTSENLKVIVRNYQTLLRQSAYPGDMLVGISRALATLPQVELDKIDWDSGAGPKLPAGPEASRTPPAATVPAAPANAEFQAQTAEISGRLLLPRASDYRTITVLVNQFAEALRKQSGMEVVSTRLPFDINAEKSITGDIGAERNTDVPRFSVTVSRRGGT